MIYSKNTQGEYKGWKCFIEHEAWSDMVKVWLIERRGNEVFNATITKGGIIEMKITKEGFTPEPLIKINAFAWGAMNQALSDALPPLKQEMIDSELKATKYHLEDMRKLLKITP